MRSVNCGAINSSVTWPVESYEAVTVIPGRSRNVSATGSPYFFFKSSLDWATTAVQIIRRMTNAFNWTPFVLIEAANAALERLAHATTDKDHSPASPLQALVRRNGWLHYGVNLFLVQNKFDSINTSPPHFFDNECQGFEFHPSSTLKINDPLIAGD